MSSFTSSHLVVLLLVASAAIVLCRPQETSNPAPASHGAFIGEIIVLTEGVEVQAKTKPKTKTESPLNEEANGPQSLRFIGGPELTVGSAAGSPSASVPVSSGPSLTISGPAITFNREAQVLSVAAN